MPQKLSPTRKEQIKSRAAKTKRPLEPVHPDLIAAGYGKKLENEIQRGFKIVEKVLFPAFKNDLTSLSQTRTDGLAEDSDKVNDLFDIILDKYFGAMFSGGNPNLTGYSKNVGKKLVDPMQAQVDRHNKTQFSNTFKRISGVDPLKFEPGLTDFMDVAGEQNVNKIVSVNSQYFDDIKQLTYEALREGKSVDELTGQIEALTEGLSETKIVNGKIKNSQARLIAIDQVQKLNADLESQRQQNNGLTRYAWRTRRAANVRSFANSSGYSDHAGLEGAVIDWRFAPQTVFKGKRAGETNHPGKDIL